jgi:SAM-dependent methyltransferase
MEMYDDPKHVKDTFNEDNLSEYLLQAQWAEFTELKKAISEIYKRKKSKLAVLDIGVGDARIPKHLSGIDEIWSMISKYDGIDVAQNCIDISEKVAKDLNLTNKMNVKLLDAVNLKALNRKYDLILSTWFTVGNFYPFNFDFKNFKHGDPMLKNDKFEKIFQQAYNMLNPKGEIIIGSMYIDNNETRKKQETAYKHFGWTITSDKTDCFTSSKEGWWSQRYTQKRVHDYLNFIPKSKISFIALDTYGYAMMVRIKK